ncbi:uncharacterized protein HD556DRAFT_1380705 [Suillus plorans]|uniref:Uncharacterized protein n=1 Tax=Suillus plorans TaxID=116603 RepID=A0A9P7DH16_9AGAM|nr:uncharacterized protein HD556DRAFT_1380705 [Suillus plorans]KAG1792346.1 hypothetical protein HD556DRAFT_1380705 [Suillus plorans]
MRLSFLAIVTALTASMSVSACAPPFQICIYDRDCCPPLTCGNEIIEPAARAVRRDIESFFCFRFGIMSQSVQLFLERCSYRWTMWTFEYI